MQGDLARATGCYEEARAHYEHWAMAPPERSARAVRFATDPTWRAYVITYSAGRAIRRAGPLRDSSLRARRVKGLEAKLVAAPAYLEAHPPPATVAELGQRPFGVYAVDDHQHLIGLE